MSYYPFYLYFDCRVTENKIKTILEESGIIISEGQISNILTKEKKEELLLVLKFPEIPLHNNPAELALREGVVKRKISNGTRSDDGKAAWENMMSGMDTCRKHGICLYDYIKDIFSGKREMTRLSTLIAQKASMNPT